MSCNKKIPENTNKLLNHRLWIAEESPEPMIDLSGCSLTRIPDQIFSICRVNNKEALLLYDNCLTSLPETSRWQNLSSLLVLDLHGNQLQLLPPQIEYLINLQVLNLSHNLLKSLPSQIGKLLALQSFNVSHNAIVSLPENIKSLRLLRSLNISANKVTHLPVDLCCARALETLVLDTEQMVYPSRVICQQGIEAIMMHLCKDAGMAYVSPSNGVLLLLSKPDHTANMDLNKSACSEDREEEDFGRCALKVDRQDVLLALEQHEQSCLSKLAETRSSQKNVQLVYLAQHINEEETLLNKLHRNPKNAKLLEIIKEEEAASARLIAHIMERRKLSDVYRDNEIDPDEQRALSSTESVALRKKEMLAKMKALLDESEEFQSAVHQHQQMKRDTNIDELQNRLQSENEYVLNKLAYKHLESEAVLNKILQEESWQRRAFISMMKLKDSKHLQLTRDISLLEEQLSRLSFLEIRNRSRQLASNLEMIDLERRQLVVLLQELLTQREERNNAISRKMAEMEASKDDGMDFWLRQMQRLLDWKPPILQQLEAVLDPNVIDILRMSGAEGLIPLFAKHRVTWKTFKELTDNDLKMTFGIYDTGMRSAIRSQLEKLTHRFSGTTPVSPSAPSDDNANKAEDNCQKYPSTSLTSATSAVVDLPAPCPPVIVTHITAECVVCMEAEACVIFLPCGHICVCQACCQSLKCCPLCRAAVHQRVLLEM